MDLGRGGWGLTGLSHKMSELAPCQFWIRLDSKILRNLMVNQRPMLGMWLLVGNAIAVLVMDRC